MKMNFLKSIRWIFNRLHIMRFGSVRFIIKFYLGFIINTLEELMEATMAYQRLKQIFPHHLENINLYQISSKDIDSFIPKNLPYVSMDTIHRLCRSQEKNVNSILFRS